MKKIYTELVKEISRNTEVEETIVRKIMDNFIDTVKGMRGQNEGVIYLKGLGKFYVKTISKKRCALANCKKMLPAIKTIAFHKSDKVLNWDIK